MRTAGWMVGLGLLVTAGTATARVEVRVVAPQSRTLSTSLTYDAEQNMLAVTCAVSSDGLCRMTIVDGGRRKLLSMRPASRVVVRGVSRGARVCALGRSGGVCDWRAVSA